MKISKEKYDELTAKLEAIQNELRNAEIVETEKEKPVEWFNGEDRLVFNSGEHGDERIEFESNHKNWKFTKEQVKDKDILMIDVYENDMSHTTAATAITLEQMITLRDYLTHKIDYLNEPEDNETECTWIETDDELKISSERFVGDFVSIKSNWNTWSEVKGRGDKEELFYVKLMDNETSSSAGLTLNQAKQIYNYLGQKIKYIES